MRIRVHMLAFGEQDKIRNVKVSDLTYPESILDEVFYKGQNDFADTCDRNQKLRSVSVGYVIEYPDGEFHIVKSVGFKKIGCDQFLTYSKCLDKKEREAVVHFLNLGD